MNQRLVFIGAGLAVGEIIEIVRDINHVQLEQLELVAIVDDDATSHGRIIEGVPVIGSLSRVHEFPDARFIFGIGSYRTRGVRERIIDRLGIPHDRFMTLIHPSAKIYTGARIGHGCVIYPFCVVCAEAILEDFCIVAFHSVIGPRALLEAFVMIATHVTVLTGARIGKASFIGVRSVVAEGKTIGAGAVIVMGAMVLRDVPSGVVMAGNPAIPLYRQG